MALLVTGTIGIDTVETPQGQAGEVLGGSAAYAGWAGALFTDIRLVAAIGDDLPAPLRAELDCPRIDASGLELRSGSKTFRWAARYTPDMNDRETLYTHLNVLEEKPPRVPDAFANTEVVFLANTHPTLQRELLSQAGQPGLTVCDTMNLWIDNEPDELRRTLAVVDGVIINDAEVRDLTGQMNLITAGRAVLDIGPRFVVIKKGEHGAMLVTADDVTIIPAFPMASVCDPTGAGDSFAGGMLGYLDQCGTYDTPTLRRALVRGTVSASFTIEDFSLRRLRTVTPEQVEQRVGRFVEMLRIE